MCKLHTYIYIYIKDIVRVLVSLDILCVFLILTIIVEHIGFHDNLLGTLSMYHTEL